MAHWAKVVDGKVSQVIVADEQGLFFQTYVDTSPGTWLRTSYNTVGNQHPEGRPFRGNFAGIGYHYDPVADIFYAPQPYPSWVLSPKTFLWESPVAMPTDDKTYEWDESSKTWVEKNV